jgi:hypothetical protein
MPTAACHQSGTTSAESPVRSRMAPLATSRSTVTTSTTKTSTSSLPTAQRTIDSPSHGVVSFPLADEKTPSTKRASTTTTGSSMDFWREGFSRALRSSTGIYLRSWRSDTVDGVARMK